MTRSSKNKKKVVLDTIEIDEVKKSILKSKYKIILAALILSYIVFFSLLNAYNLNHFHYNDFDLAISNQALYLLSNFEDPFITIRGLNIFGDHARFIDIFLAPFYWIAPGALTILVLQTIALGLGAIPLYLIARERIGEKVTLLVIVAYLLYPALHFVTLDSYHSVSLTVPLLLSAFYFLLEKKYKHYFISVLLVLLLNEVMATVVFLLGIYVFVKHDRKFGLISIASACLWLLFIMAVAFPALNPGGHVYSDRWFGSFGDTWTDKAFRTTDIEFMSNKLGTQENAMYMFDLLAPVGFIPILSPIELLLPATLYINILSDWAYSHTIRYHYVASIIPFIFISLIFSLERFRKKKYYYAIIGILVLGMAIGNVQSAPWDTSIMHLEGFKKISEMNTFSNKELAMYYIVEKIPSNVFVSASYKFLPKLSLRKDIYMFTNPFFNQYWGNPGDQPELVFVEYIVVDTELLSEKDEALFRLLEESGTYRRFYTASTIVGLKKVSEPTSQLRANIEAFRH